MHMSIYIYIYIHITLISYAFSWIIEAAKPPTLGFNIKKRLDLENWRNYIDRRAHREETDRKCENTDQDEDEEGEDISKSMPQGCAIRGLRGRHWRPNRAPGFRKREKDGGDWGLMKGFAGSDYEVGEKTL